MTTVKTNAWVYTHPVTKLALFKCTKWHHPSHKIHVGDLVILREDSAISANRPLGRVIKVHPGKDNLLRMATVKTNTRVYTHPVTKLALLLPSKPKKWTDVALPIFEDQLVLASGMLDLQNVVNMFTFLLVIQTCVQKEGAPIVPHAVWMEPHDVQ